MRSPWIATIIENHRTIDCFTTLERVQDIEWGSVMRKRCGRPLFRKLRSSSRSRCFQEARGDNRSIPGGAIKIALPEVQQPDDYSCGAACLMAVCAYFGVGPEDLEDLKNSLKTNRYSGTYYGRIVKKASRLGLHVHLYQGGMSLGDLKAALTDGKPVILSIQAYAQRAATYANTASNSDGHYVVAIGFDDSDTIYFMDPSLTGRIGFLTWKELDHRWHENEGNRRKPEIYSHLAIVLSGGRRRPAYHALARHID